MNRPQPPYIERVDKMVQDNQALRAQKAALLEQIKKRQAINPLRIGKR